MAPADAQTPGLPSRLRVWLVALGLALLTVLLAPLQVVAIRLHPPTARRLPMLWHRIARRIAGIGLHVRGAPARGRPLLLVSNHQSWADIVALGAAMPLCFVAKEEVRGWGPFGWLARLQRTVFVGRARRGETGRQADAIGRRLVAGDAMVLFAEGTTSDGNGVFPFRTALFGAAAAALREGGGTHVLVQPVAVCWTRVHGLPMGRYARPLAAWPGDVPLLPHLAAFLREGAVDAEIVFGTPIRFGAAGDRKALARRVEREVRMLHARTLRDPA